SPLRGRWRRGPVSWVAMVRRVARPSRRSGLGLRGVRGFGEGVRYRRVVTYAVSTPTFEGPIDLLLHLVSSHEVDVLDIPLMPIIDGFVRVLTEQRDQIDLNQLSEFLLMAAIL